MFKNYLKMAWRNIRKQKFYSFINILGLTTGMTCCFLIFMYVRFELSYDSFHERKQQIYRLTTDVETPTEKIEAAITSMPMGPALKQDFPEVKEAVRINLSNMLVLVGNNKYQEDEVAVADSNFFHVFTFPLVSGNEHTVLSEPFSVVLSESAARKYFGTANAIGRSIQIGGREHTVKVTGVMKDVPENSQLAFNMVFSLATYKALGETFENWGSFGVVTYLLLESNVDPYKLEQKFPPFLEHHVGMMMKESKMRYTLHLENISDVYLHSKREGSQVLKGSMPNVYIFSFVAVFILLIAIINFVNLATARATERAREVGVRKSVGAYESQLTFQFLSETLMLSLFAFVLSVTCCQLLLPAFNLLTGKEIANNIFQTGTVGIFILMAIAIGLLAGVYPAIVLASYKPVVVLKGAFSSSHKGLLLRRGLVVFQFVITIVLVAGVIIVYNQLLYMQSRDLGFKKDQQLVVEFSGIDPIKDKWKEIKQQVSSIQGVKGCAFSSAIPSKSHSSAYSNMELKSGDMQASNLNLYFVDYDFLQLYDIQLVAGRGFSEAMGTDSTQAMVVNEATVASLGYSKPEEIIGRKYSQWGSEGKVIGVIKDFNYHSLRDKVEPLTMRVAPAGFMPMTITVNPANIKKTLAAVEAIYNRYAPDGRFNYFFVDDSFDKQYRGEYRFGRLVLTFTILAIFLATLGLLGLISFIVIQRTKEIGIRKVLGASVGSILFLLSGDFLKLVLIALLVATPLAWYLMYQWLSDFAYRIDIQWWVFVLAGGIAVILSLATVYVQTIKTALTSPVKSLRTE
ncbi:ABC transporter permease [Chitinophaga rhizophila]|uniref:ABC transporter permease n=1 Tax=Chitinophaga rhizophila TaxID=2866212 RepID=A0ABS7GIK5_9BACT|nr:ABC transporter permease [Chitinophaga rhizophila]MBW8686308.1 ABC transporter permease [Chitinophaga rhizophila]